MFFELLHASDAKKNFATRGLATRKQGLLGHFRQRQDLEIGNHLLALGFWTKK
jgi:hypothetical protein